MKKNPDRLVLKSPKLDGEADGRFAIIALVVIAVCRLMLIPTLAGAMLGLVHSYSSDSASGRPNVGAPPAFVHRAGAA